MAFVSIGQKYGFVSIGDYFRQQMAEELDKERQQMVEEKLRTARALYEDGVPIEILVKRFNLTEEQIRGK